MKTNNKGFSLIEMVIVIAIIAILAALSMVTFYMANSRRPEKVKYNFTYCADYAKNLAKAQDQDSCMVLFQNDRGEYYAVQGVGKGTTMAELGGSDADLCFTSKNGNGDKVSLATLMADPNSVVEKKNLGRNVQIWYKDTAGGSEKLVGSDDLKCLFIKYRKFDGSVMVGAGEYLISEYDRSNKQEFSQVTIKLDTVLEESTGVFHNK